MLSGMRSHYIKPGATGGDIVPADRPAREERTDRNQTVGKGESRIGKPAPLNTARVRHPESQGRLKGWATRVDRDFGMVLFRLDS